MLVGRHPVAQLGGDRLKVARASKLLGAEAFGHLACELRDVTLLGCVDEDSLHAERLQLGCTCSAAFRIPVNPRHVPTLFALRPRSVGSSDMAVAWARALSLEHGLRRSPLIACGLVPGGPPCAAPSLKTAHEGKALRSSLVCRVRVPSPASASAVDARAAGTAGRNAASRVPSCPTRTAPASASRPSSRVAAAATRRRTSTIGKPSFARLSARPSPARLRR
jgi:hypothetical protein